MKVLFITNIPTPYRVDFFNELGKKCDLVVCYELKKPMNRDPRWKVDQAKYYREVYAKVKPISINKSIGFGIIKEINREQFDELIITGYSSLSVILAIIYCRVKKIEYYIESDGGFNREDSFLKYILKKYLLIGAKGHFVTCDEYIDYLKKIGVNKNIISKYHFSSIKSKDILKRPVNIDEKQMLKKSLGVLGNKMIISVGQFIYRKGFDILLDAASRISKDISVYIIGGKPTAELEEQKQKLGLNNVFFIDFKTKEELKKWYMASDLFVLPTREDIWGLVINEAMACGLPIITTDRCIAGLEMIDDKFIVPTNNSHELARMINMVICNENLKQEMAECNIKKIYEYTIETMCNDHLRILAISGKD